MVITHELTHIVHIEQAGGLYGFGRRIFGRAPFLFPDALQPTWFIEGLAVREETKGTAFGRGRQTFTKMVVDEAARSGQLERLDQATLGLDRWPLGNAAYLFGEEFLNSLETRYGEGSARDIALAHGRSFHPYQDSRTFRATTGESLGSLWRDFARRRASSRHPSLPPKLLTTRGVIQTNPRLSPDRSLIAYTSRTLDRLGEIRLMKTDGSSDRRLVARLSGGALSWSRDGAFLVFDETNQVRKFESRSDLYRVEVRSGRRTRLTTGLRASDPDLGPGAAGKDAAIVFVQRFADRSELSILGPGESPRVLTTSPPGTEWSHPRFSPSGDAVVASRMRAGFLDLVLLDLKAGELRALTHDRAVDAEPSWVSERTLIFRSDRMAETFRLFLVDRDGSNLRVLQDSPENAFTPEVDAAAKIVYYAHYSASGYDLALTPYVEGAAPDPYVDSFPPATEEPEAFGDAARPYSALASLRPRFVSPLAEVVSDELRIGLATASFDPLGRATYALIGSWGTRVSKPNGLVYFRYDRFTPAITALARVESSPSNTGSRDLAEGRLSVDFPLERSALRSQTIGATVRRRVEDLSQGTLDTGIAAIGYQLDSTRSYPMSISPRDGFRLRVAATRELKALGSDLRFGKVIVDAAAYIGLGKTVVAARLGGGWTFGSPRPQRAYAVGGLASPALLDPVGDEPAVLRGYEAPDGGDASRYGRSLAFSNLEWRIPLAHPQRGLGAFPFFLRHLYLTASLDAAVVSPGRLDLGSARVGASLGLGAAVLLGHRIPLTLQGGVGQGLTRDGRTVPWFSIGFPF
jgi:hypothetical protein